VPVAASASSRVGITRFMAFARLVRSRGLVGSLQCSTGGKIVVGFKTVDRFAGNVLLDQSFDVSELFDFISAHQRIGSSG
jgi:hypothetical protein